VSDAELPERAKAWVLSCVPGATALIADAHLAGGISADTRLVTVAREQQRPLEVVLKRFTDVERGICVRWEAAALRALQSAGLPYATAAVLGEDEAGLACDVPALLMTRLAGQIALEVRGSEARVAELGTALAALHLARLPCPVEVPDYIKVGEKQREKSVPDVVLPDWHAVWEFVDARSWDGSELMHGDYHLGNALFDGERLTAIIDWASARRGAHELDVAYCRLDLSMVLGGEAPARFLEAYEARYGARVDDVSAWDLGASVRAFPDPVSWLPGWLDAGRRDLTPEIIRRRLCGFVQNALDNV
jgi:aminoglycoside phosphotransferase (APT) family kinase protein